MKYAFKMMAVIFLTFGISGCAEVLVAEAVIATINAANNSSSYVGKKYKPVLKRESNNRVCAVATRNGAWSINNDYVQEAKRRGLDCGVRSGNKTFVSSKPKTKTYTQPKSTLSSADYQLCRKATDPSRSFWSIFQRDQRYVMEAKRRGLDCGIGSSNKTFVSSKPKTKTYTQPKSTLSSADYQLCRKATDPSRSFWSIFQRDQRYVMEAKRLGLDCGVDGDNKTVIASKPEIKTYTQPKSTISSAELDAANKRARELERKLAALESKQKQEQQRIDTDTRVPLLEIISIKTKGKRGTITGIARDNIEVAEVTVDSKPISLSSNGNFKYSTYVPPTGKELKIQVTDIAGLTSSKVVVLKADRAISDSSISYDSLNPLGKRAKINKNALALIVGVSNYENTKAKALYADNDAMVFKDYASEKLGIPENRIKMLVNDGADYGEILVTTKDWLRRASKSNKSDIYIFFAGHGLASDDGKNMYLLPYDGRPRLLDKTALLRDELFKEIQQSNPRSVTVFLDTCYSGTTRGTDMLIASRPIAIRALEQSIPSNFTVFSAAAGDQTSKPLEEAKHGMFSYFLMKGMEGDADANADNKITARELHTYVEQNVVQQSSGSQTPE
ncbi:caspase family protein, partial [Alphaproteobacteria bacterium]|nr:caspase family protein [Alphaproteobacteria bacterium]